MAGPQKESKGTGAKTVEKKGIQQKKADPVKQSAGGQRTAKSPGVAKAVQKGNQDKNKDEKQTKPVKNVTESKSSDAEVEEAKSKTSDGDGSSDTSKFGKVDDNGDKELKDISNETKDEGVKVEDSKTENKSSAKDEKESKESVTKSTKVVTAGEKAAVQRKETPKPSVGAQKSKSVGQKEAGRASNAEKDNKSPRDTNAGVQKSGTGSQKTSAVSAKTPPTATGEQKKALAQKAEKGVQRPGGGQQKPGAGSQSAVGESEKKVATPKVTPVANAPKKQPVKAMETPTKTIGKTAAREIPPGKAVTKPDDGSKSPRKVPVSASSPASVAEKFENGRASKASVASSKMSDSTLKLDLSSSSSGLPSFPGSAVGVRTPGSSAAGSLSDAGDKLSGVGIMLSTDADTKVGEQSDTDDKVRKDADDNKTDHVKSKTGNPVEKSAIVKIEKEAEKQKLATKVNKLDNKIDKTRVDSGLHNENVNSGANINTVADSKTIIAKQVIASSDAKDSKLADAKVNEAAEIGVIIPVPVLTSTSSEEGKGDVKETQETKTKNREIKVVKEAKDAAKEGKENKSKDKLKNAKKESDGKDSKSKDTKEKEAKVGGKVVTIADSKAEEIKDKPKVEVQENLAPKREKSWNLFSRDSKKEVPGKAEKADKSKKKDKNSKSEKGKTDNVPLKPALKKGKSAWSRISTKDVLAGAHAMSGEVKQNGVGTTPVSDLGRKESMSVLTVPNSNSHEEGWQGKPDAKSLRSTGSRLSVTSARRASMESRRSVDIRGGLLNAAVINPPGEEKPKSLLASDETYIQSAIPILPLPAAVICLLLNILLPGIGTVMSGFAVYCCGKPRVNSKTGDQKTITFCVNIWVGVAQLFTVTFCLVGWAWSIGWGVKMVGHSIQYRQELKERREKTLQTMALSAFAGSPVRRMMGFTG